MVGGPVTGSTNRMGVVKQTGKHCLEMMMSDEMTRLREQLTVRAELATKCQQIDAVNHEDRFEQGFNQGLTRAVEAIAEWLVPFRNVNNTDLSALLITAMPEIMREIVGLEFRYQVPQGTEAVDGQDVVPDA